MRPTRQPGDIFENASDLILLFSLTLAAVVSTGTWLTGQLAALLFRRDWPPVSIGQALTAAWRLPGDVRDPRLAWPASVRPQLPGPAGFLVAGILASLAVMAIMLWLGSWALSHRPQRGYASRDQIKATLSERAVIRRGPVVRPSLLKRWSR
jgi:type IV secretion system protein VirD4